MKFLVFLVFYSCAVVQEVRVDLIAEKVSDDLILLAPMSTDSKNFPSNYVYLIDKNINVKHRWKTNYPPLSTELGKKGELYYMGFEKKPKFKRSTYIIHPHFEVLDSKNNVLWSYYNNEIHHDFTLIPGGHFAFIATDRADVRGYDIGELKANNLLNNELLFDKIIEVDPRTNKTVWEWSFKDQVSFESLKPLHPMGDLIHLNSIQFTKANIINNKPAYLISARHTNTVYLIDRGSKKVLWQSPKGMFTKQHDARFLRDGTISVFDNGEKLSSSVIVDPRTDKLLWVYEGGQGAFDKFSYFSSVVSGVTELSNGNMLSTLGVGGFLTEVTRDKDVVWRYFVDLLPRNPSTKAWPFDMVFRATAYPSSIMRNLN